MNLKHTSLAVAGAVALLLPTVLVAQMDPTANPGVSPYPQSPQNMNQPTATTATGAQATPSTAMPDSLGAPGQTGQQMIDKQFVRAAAESGIADVKLGTLAVQKGGPEVKDLAQKMVDDHTAMNKDMDTVADSLGVMLPKKMNKDGQKEYEKLNALSGKDFDTEYINYMAKSHFEDLHSFHMEASAAADPDLATEVVKAMGMMHQHLGLIVSAAKAEDIALPPRPQRPAPATTASK